MEAARRFFIGDFKFEANTPWGGWAAFFMSISFFVFQIVITVAIGTGLVVALPGVEVFQGKSGRAHV